ncbi:hypothetical protein R6Q59_032616 [Mikania micrantha]
MVLNEIWLASIANVDKEGREGVVTLRGREILSLSRDLSSNSWSCRTSVPEAKKEEQEQEVVLSRPSSSATTTVVVANGDPPFRKVTGPAVRPKVVCHSYGADRFTTSAPLSDISG